MVSRQVSISSGQVLAAQSSGKQDQQHYLMEYTYNGKSGRRMLRDEGNGKFYDYSSKKTYNSLDLFMKSIGLSSATLSAVQSEVFLTRAFGERTEISVTDTRTITAETEFVTAGKTKEAKAPAPSSTSAQGQTQTTSLDLSAYKRDALFSAYLEKNYPPKILGVNVSNTVLENTPKSIFEKIDAYLEENSERINIAYRLINEEMRETAWNCGGKYLRSYQTTGSEEIIRQIVLASFIQEYLSNGRYDASLFLAIAGQETNWNNIQANSGKGPFQITTSSSVTSLKDKANLQRYNKYRVECGMQELGCPVTNKNSDYKTNIYLNSIAAIDTCIEKEMILNGTDSKKHVDEADSLKMYNGNKNRHPTYKTISVRDAYKIQTDLLYNHIYARINP
ncbi:MAG: hypothetical protein WC588_02245 [Candidatus Micrarchaeia archaeon]